MAISKIKKGDEVIVLTGKAKGKRGKVLRVLENRVLVEGVNMLKKHVRPNPQKGVQGGIVDQEAAIHISNIAVYNGVKKTADRVGIKVLKDGRRVRYFKSNNEVVDV